MSAKLRTAFLLAALAASTASAMSNAAVITLTMPVGARQLGMGETSTGLADDVFAPYWNPAGLAFGPLADEWDLVLGTTKLPGPITALATVKRTSLFSTGDVWVACGSNLRAWNGKKWRTGIQVSLGQNDQVISVARRVLGNLWPLDTTLQNEILGKIRLASGSPSAAEDKDLVDLTIPYDLAVKDSITAITVDETGKLWIGTNNGLLRYDGRTWRAWQDSASLLPSRKVTALSTMGAVVWVGTDSGLVRLRQKGSEFEFRRFGQEYGLGSQHVTALAIQPKTRTIWVGTNGGGVSRLEITREASTWKNWTKADGVLSDTAVHMNLDSRGGIWIAHEQGVSHYDGKGWERLDFQGVKITSVAVDANQNVWITSNKGAWKYFPKSAQQALAGGKLEGSVQGRWLHFHSGNGLFANNASFVAAQGDNLWFATSSGLVRSRKAQAQVGFFYETLLPKLGIKDLFHTYVAGTFPVEEWGTFGGQINFVSFGENSMPTNENDPEGTQQTFSSYEMVAAASYGTRINRNWGLGVNFKFIYSALAPGFKIEGSSADGTAASYAFDVATLGKNLLVNGLNWGFTVQNIGPSVYYVDRNRTDPIPLTWRTGLSYRLFDVSGHTFTVAGDFSRETTARDKDGVARNFATGVYYALKNPWGFDDTTHQDAGVSEIFMKNLRESTYNLGAEYVYSGLLALRSGLLLDPSGGREELDVGVGVMLSDVLQLDYAYIQDAPWVGGSQAGVREGQSRFSMNFIF